GAVLVKAGRGEVDREAAFLGTGADDGSVDATDVGLRPAPQDALLARDGPGLLLAAVGRVEGDLLALLFFGAGLADDVGLESVANPVRLLAQPSGGGVGEHLLHEPDEVALPWPVGPVSVDTARQQHDP